MLNKRPLPAKLCRLAWLPLLLALAGCIAVGPDYAPPQSNPPANWTSANWSGQLTSESINPLAANRLARWWQQLNDPLLSELITAAIEGNWDIREAQQRVREARARRGSAAADRLATLSASSSVRQSRVDPPHQPGATTKLYDTSLDARWELGLFGGKRRALEAATADWQASQADLADVLVSVAAEVALNYVDLRSFQTRLAITRRNLATQAQTHDIARWRNQAGLATQIDVEQARQNLEQTRAQIPVLVIAQQRAINRLATLLGNYPDKLSARLLHSQPIPTADLGIAIGIPAEALRQRPDIRAAERRLAAQTARIGVATAARYPDLTLVGSIGVEALSSRDMFSSTTLLTSTLADLGLTLFDGGRLRQNIAVQTAAQAQALARYESAVRVAVEEVENALIAFSQEQLRRQSLALATEAAELAADLVRNQYGSGLLDFQRVLDAERSVLTLQDQLATSDGQIAANLIRLYKALGGGWTPLESSPDESSKGTTSTTGETNQ